MSFSPESFDRLLADKLAQAPAPAYEPAHWDQLEDQLQHLNQALQQAAQPAPSAGTSPGAGASAVPGSAPLAGMLAKAGFAALLTGLTAINGYFFYAASSARDAAETTVEARVTFPAPAPVAANPAPSPVVPASESALARGLPAAQSAPMPGVVARVPQSAPTAVFAPMTEVVTPPTTGAPAPMEQPTLVPMLPVAAPSSVVPTASPLATASAAPTVPTAPRADSAAVRLAPAPENSLVSGMLPNIITPNGDDRNDRLELPLPAGTCRLRVFDQLGRVVFQAERYDNSWDGGSLPAGDYRYLVEPLSAATRSTLSTLTIVRAR